MDKIQQALMVYADTVWPYVEAAWRAFDNYAYLQAAFLAAFGFLFARLVSSYLPELLKKATRNIKAEVAADIIELTRSLLFNLLFLGALILAVSVSGLNAAPAFALKGILKSGMIAVVGLFIYRLARLLLTYTATTGKGRGIIQPQTLPLFINTVMVFVLVGTSHQIFAVWDVDMTALLASAGIAGIAIGMAAQGMLADVIAGILILTDGPYRLGDIIRLDGEGTEIRGRVTRIGIRSTRILADDNIEIIVPNSVMGHSRILNESSAKETGRAIRLEITTACGVESARIRSLLLDIADQEPHVMKGMEHTVDLLGFDRQHARFEFICWVANAELMEPVSFSLREAVYARLLAEKIPLALASLEEVNITHLPDSRQEVAITHLPDSRQEISIKEMPASSSSLYIKEMPNLFGVGSVKPTASQHPPTPVSRSLSKQDDAPAVKEPAA